MYTQIPTEMDVCTFKAACTHARTGSGLVDGGSVMAAVKAKPRRKHQSQKLDRAFHLEGSGSLDLNLYIFICSCVFAFVFECLYFIEGKATTQASVTEAMPGIPARWNPANCPLVNAGTFCPIRQSFLALLASTNHSPMTHGGLE